VAICCVNVKRFPHEVAARVEIFFLFQIPFTVLSFRFIGIQGFIISDQPGTNLDTFEKPKPLFIRLLEQAHPIRLQPPCQVCFWGREK